MEDFGQTQMKQEKKLHVYHQKTKKLKLCICRFNFEELFWELLILTNQLFSCLQREENSIQLSF